MTTAPPLLEDETDCPAMGTPVERGVGRHSEADVQFLLSQTRETVRREVHETLRTIARCAAVCLSVYIVTEALKAWAGVH